MYSIHKIKKPEYYFRPLSIFKKIFDKPRGQSLEKMPWQSQIQVNTDETIGKAIHRTGIYDLAVTEALWRLIEPGNFVLDIGANIGYTTNICSYKAGPDGVVWAFEPNPLLQSRIKQNLALNKYQNTRFFAVGLSDTNKKGRLVIPRSYNFNEGVAYISEDADGQGVEVSLMKLDDLLPEEKSLDVLKIDVEGHELAVFKGAKNALKNSIIKNIVFEDHESYPSDVSKLLLTRGYTIFRIEKGWLNISLADPVRPSHVSPWEPTSYIATLDPGFVKKKMQGFFYQSI